MNQIVIERVLETFKVFEFERAHEMFLREVEKSFPKLSQEQQVEFGSLLELYEDAYHNSDVIRIADIICYYIYPMTVHAG